MITILNETDRHLLKLARLIKKANLKIYSLDCQVLVHHMNGAFNDKIQAQFERKRIQEEKEELMKLIEKI